MISIKILNVCNFKICFILLQIVIVLAMAAVASALPVLQYAEPEAPANYQFQYSVHDNQSGDIKQQQEARAGDAVRGSYSLVQPDGLHRVVDYSADKESGFNAIVRYEGKPIVSVPAKIAYAPVAKVAYSAPVVYSAPVAYAAPVAKLAYAAPLAHVSYSSPVISYQH